MENCWGDIESSMKMGIADVISEEKSKNVKKNIREACTFCKKYSPTATDSETEYFIICWNVFIQVNLWIYRQICYLFPVDRIILGI